jgi:hypothetical protein
VYNADNAREALVKGDRIPEHMQREAYGYYKNYLLDS